MRGGNLEASRVTMEINIEEREGEEDRRKRWIENDMKITGMTKG